MRRRACATTPASCARSSIRRPCMPRSASRCATSRRAWLDRQTSQGGDAMTKIFDGYCKLLDALIALALAVMVVLVFGNVVLRYAFNSGITVSEEVSRWL